MKRYLIIFLLLCSPCLAEETYDPIEPVNRGIFWFNDTLDSNILSPVSEVYNEYIPQGARSSVKNFFVNLKTPIYLVSDLLQGDFTEFGNHSLRFLMNTTAGVGGLFDIAADAGFEHKDADIGTAFGKWGIGGGPYIVLPLFGPSNLRDLVGEAGDWSLNPMNAAIVYPPIPNNPYMDIGAGLNAASALSTRAGLESSIKSGKESSVDYYLFVREAYTQYRQGLIYDGMPPEENEVEE